MDKLLLLLCLCILAKLRTKEKSRSRSYNRRSTQTKNTRRKNEKGAWITPAFPKLIYVLEEQNITEDAPYFYLTELAAKCTAKRMVPDYISEKIMLELKKDKNGEGHCYTCMGCRSFLTPYLDKMASLNITEDLIRAL